MKVCDLSDIYQTIKNCRTCNSDELTEVLDLGLHPLANSLLDDKENPEVKAPLVLIRCQNCTTIQLSINVRPELMFQEYLWVTGTTETAKNHCNELAKAIIQTFEIFLL